MDNRQAYQIGRNRGYSFAVNCDPEDLDEVFEIETNARQYADFCFLAAEINRCEDADELWDRFEEGLADGIEEGQSIRRA